MTVLGHWGYILIAYIVMEYTVMAYIVMACTVMAYVVMVYIVMAGIDHWGYVDLSGVEVVANTSGGTDLSPLGLGFGFSVTFIRTVSVAGVSHQCCSSIPIIKITRAVPRSHRLGPM